MFNQCFEVQKSFFVLLAKCLDHYCNKLASQMLLQDFCLYIIILKSTDLYYYASIHISMYNFNYRKAVMALLTHEKDKTASEILRSQNNPSPLKLLIQHMPGMYVCIYIVNNIFADDKICDQIVVIHMFSFNVSKYNRYSYTRTILS